MPNVCRLCADTIEDGMYCEMCVPNPRLRSSLNKIDTGKANMMLVDFRAKNGMSYRAAGMAAQTDESRWRIAELYPKQGLTRPLMQRIAYLVGVEVETLFDGYLELQMGNTKKGGRISRVIGNDAEPVKPEKPKAIHLPPGVSQHLLSLDCRTAMEAGYGHSYGKWRAGVII